MDYTTLFPKDADSILTDCVTAYSEAAYECERFMVAVSKYQELTNAPFADAETWVRENIMTVIHHKHRADCGLTY